MSSDPVPGDPDEIQGVIRRYGDIGDAAEKALNVLKRDGDVARGRGSAMDKLREKIGDDLPDKLSKTAQSYHDAADAYRAYLPQLQEAQDTFDRAVDQAEPVAATAAKSLAGVVSSVADAAGGTEPTAEQQAEQARQQQEIEAAQQQMSAARSLAQQAKSMRDTAERVASDALDRAASEAIPERNIFQKISDFFADFPFVQILLGLLIAAVAVFFPVAGLLLGGALFAVTQISAIASGNFKAGDFLLGLVGLVPGGSLLKAAGASVKAGAGVVAKVAPAVTKAGKGSINGIGTSFGSTKTIGPLVNSTGGKAAGEGIKGFGEEAGAEVINQAAEGDGFDAGAILGAGALGAAGGVAGGVAGSKISKGSNAGGIPVKTGPGGNGTRSLPGGSAPIATPSSLTTPAPGTVPASLGLPLNTDGGIDLKAQELQGGHAIDRHVGKTQADLDQRLNGTKASPGVKAVRPIPSASTFTDITVAERATSDNISANQAQIAAFLAAPAAGPGGKPDRLVIKNPIPSTDGITRLGPKNKANPTPGTISQTGVSQVSTVLQKDPTAPGGFRIITSFPEP
ncbi:RNase A-like domain-containing protein [Actinoplanes solisilvae]|uniref:RNase A-like domain-containing protein n=1 Tax=Actinoplanes solisilvae TaxID=2486853 RepID=UPI000FD96A4E|nr:RNase A-like domain-containing protein [Actinoplanes solisilvae]